MHFLSTKRLRAFWEVHEEAKEPLTAFRKVVEKAEWKNFSDIRTVYSAKVSKVGTCYVFNIRNNDFRLVAKISYDWTRLQVCVVMTHKEYDSANWKDTCQCNS